MALVDSLSNSNLGLGGNTPSVYSGNSVLNNSLGSTQLDKNDGATPSPYIPADLKTSLGSTQLDRNDGATPEQYVNNLPE